MAQTPTAVDPNAAAAPAAPTRRRASTNPRAPQGPRTVYVILQVLDEHDQPVVFDKKRVRLVGLETSAETMLGMVESGEKENAFFIRGKLERRARAGVARGTATQVGQTPAASAIGPRAA